MELSPMHRTLFTFTDGAGINVNLGDNPGDTVNLTAAQLGSFTINRTCTAQNCTQSLPSVSPFTTFNLVFNFTVPSPTGGDPVSYTITSQPTATLTATIARSGASSNFTVVTFAGSRVGLVLNDIAYSSGTVNSAQTVGLTGTLTRLAPLVGYPGTC